MVRRWASTPSVKDFVDKQVSSSDDIVTGYANRADVLTGGPGYDRLSGLGGDDVYEFRAGDGFDIVDDKGGSGGDRLSFADYRSLDAQVRRVHPEQMDVLISFAGTNDQALIKDGLAAGSVSAIEEITFADGVAWTIDSLRAHVMAGAATDGDDYIVGFDGAETLEGMGGDDRLDGRDGSDAYVFTRFDGRDVIDDTGGSGSAVDVLKIRGYAPADVRVTRPFLDRNDLQLFFEGTNDSILLKNQVTPTAGRGIERIEFSDGTIWPRAELIGRLTQGGGDAGERIVGSSGADTLIGRGSDDVLNGGLGDDTYVFARGDGRDIIEDNGQGGVDRVLVHGYQATEARLAHDSATLIVRFAGSGDEIRIVNTLNEDGYDKVEQIVFDDGAVWTMADVRTRLVSEAATAGNDVIAGFNFTETLAGGLGDDTLSGDDGNDTYVFNRGDGRDTIEDNGYYDVDRVLIHGYQPSEARLARDSATLIVRFAGSGDEIRIVNTLNEDGYDKVEQIVFDDGAVWTVADVRTRLVSEAATAGMTLSRASISPRRWPAVWATTRSVAMTATTPMSSIAGMAGTRSRTTAITMSIVC